MDHAVERPTPAFAPLKPSTNPRRAQKCPQHGAVESPLQAPVGSIANAQTSAGKIKEIPKNKLIGKIRVTFPERAYSV